DALVLQALPDVDAGRADLDAQRAVDAVALADRGGVDAAPARAARLAALGVVADDEGVAVEHRALEPGVRAHVLADLLAHCTGVPVGGEAVEEDPEALPRAEREARDLGGERARRREVGDERESGPQAD